MAKILEATPILPTRIERGPHEGYLSALLRSLSELLGRVIERLNGVAPKDGSEAFTGPLPLMEYTVATRPTASSYEGTLIYVSDGGAGAVFQGSDGTSWVNLG